MHNTNDGHEYTGALLVFLCDCVCEFVTNLCSTYSTGTTCTVQRISEKSQQWQVGSALIQYLYSEYKIYCTVYRVGRMCSVRTCGLRADEEKAMNIFEYSVQCMCVIRNPEYYSTVFMLPWYNV